MTTSPAAAPASYVRRSPMAGLFGLGFGANFFDTLGIGSFATTTAVLRLFRMVNDEDIPGTLNVGHSIPTIFEAVCFVFIIPWWIVHAPQWLPTPPKDGGGYAFGPMTLIPMAIAGGLGAWAGTGIVVKWPRRTIQKAMALALLITAGFMALRILANLNLGSGSIEFAGMALVIAVIGSVVIGSLTSLGIGNYAPTMAMTYMLGMNQKAVFPIMAASASLILPSAALRFYRAGRFDRRIVKGLAIGGVPGVFVAAFLITSLPLLYVKWIVVAVLLYTSATLWMASRQTPSSTT